MLAFPRIKPFQTALPFQDPPQFRLPDIIENHPDTTTPRVDMVESVLDISPPVLTRGCTDVTICTEIVHDIIDNLTFSQLESAIISAENTVPDLLPPELLRRTTSDSSWDFVSPVAAKT